MSRFISFLFTALVIGVVLALYVFHLPVALIATVSLGALCLGWLAALVVLPWNLFFRARHLLKEMEVSEERGIAVSASNRAEVTLMARRMLRISIGLHLVSAVLIAVGAWLADQPLGQAFAGLFALSTLFRPGFEYYGHLHARLKGLLEEVKYPRDDLAKLLTKVETLALKQKEHEEAVKQQHETTLEAIAALQGRLSQEQQARVQRDDQIVRSVEALQARLASEQEARAQGDERSERQVEELAREFEDTVERLSDNQELVSGIQAFLRLWRSQQIRAEVTR
ncbi:MAG: hypothetical protein JST92_18990 [Deltaproteobacteria bacterium]|nr:hypothetical protein [Deltaproteobacteria bacterium]